VQLDHAARAVRALCIQSFAAWNRERAAKGRPAAEVVAGIRGEAIMWHRHRRPSLRRSADRQPREPSGGHVPHAGVAVLVTARRCSASPKFRLADLGAHVLRGSTGGPLFRSEGAGAARAPGTGCPEAVTAPSPVSPVGAWMLLRLRSSPARRTEPPDGAHDDIALCQYHLIEDGWQKRREAAGGFASAACSAAGSGAAPAASPQALAARARADHLMITGDLTEDGHDEAFEVLADELARGPIPPEAVTLVPGNHDAYTDGVAFERALAGPLAPWARTSRPGAVTRIGGTVLVALSTAVHQHYTRSVGALGGDQLQVLRAMVSVRAFARGVIVLAMHHPPFGMRLPPMHWLDGFVEHRHLKGLLAEHPHVHVLHGHTHRAEDRAVRRDGPAQVFSAAAVIEAEDPLRVYEAVDGRLWPAPRQGAVSGSTEIANWVIPAARTASITRTTS
jgi:hypothetical protein